jgi:hypothetical protein
MIIIIVDIPPVSVLSYPYTRLAISSNSFSRSVQPISTFQFYRIYFLNEFFEGNSLFAPRNLKEPPGWVQNILVCWDHHRNCFLFDNIFLLCQWRAQLQGTFQTINDSVNWKRVTVLKTGGNVYFARSSDSLLP